ncbi:DsbA family protein [Dechloromonas sp. A34]|uniref:DsbA family protein n=1 Tax=Dechloromonas sp. A34 TaxID=447588 RepID=UPI0022494B42|nr:DsbA family protein [Dechloromonas sp. A34]
MVLHYIYDPFCGWCYAAAPLVSAARQVLAVQAHGGGMMAGRQRQTVSPQLRDYVMPHDRRIAELTGQPFGEAYFNGLLLDREAVLDSAPPIAAMLAAELLGGRGLDLLGRLQTAHYVEGRRIAETPALIELAGTIDLEPAAFATALEEMQGEVTLAHIEESRRLLAEAGGSGFPTFVLEQAGYHAVLDSSVYLGRPEAWQAFLEDSIRPGGREK